MRKNFFGEQRMCFHVDENHNDNDHDSFESLGEHLDEKHEIEAVLSSVKKALHNNKTKISIQGLQDKIEISILKEKNFFSLAKKFKSSLSATHLLMLSFLKGSKILKNFFLEQKESDKNFTANFQGNKRALRVLGLGDMFPVTQEYVEITYSSTQGKKRFGSSPVIGVRGIKHTRMGTRPAYIDIKTGRYLPIWDGDEVNIGIENPEALNIAQMNLEDDDRVFDGDDVMDRNGELTVNSKIEVNVNTRRHWEKEVYSRELQQKVRDEKIEVDPEREITTPEFTGTYKDLQNKVNGELKYEERIPLMDTDVLELMRKISNKFGDGVKFSCTLRTTEDNTDLKKKGYEVANNSYHMYGLAFDISNHSRAGLRRIKRYIDSNFSSIGGDKVHTYIHGKPGTGGRHLHVSLKKDLRNRKKFTDKSTREKFKQLESQQKRKEKL